MSMLECLEPYWSCCDTSISPSKFNAFSAETEEKINDLQEQIDDIEASGITYSAGTNIDITDHVISVTGIDTSTFASKEDLNELSGKVETISGDVITISGDLSTKQDTLVSSVNIKTINGNSLLGSGNIDIQGGGTIDDELDINSDNAVANSAITNAINAISGDVITISGNTENKQDKLTAGSFINIDNSNTISAKIIILTQAQWQALTVKDNSVLYLIKED